MHTGAADLKPFGCGYGKAVVILTRKGGLLTGIANKGNRAREPETAVTGAGPGVTA